MGSAFVATTVRRSTMQLTGVRVPSSVLSQPMAPNTVLVAISDEKGAVDVIQINKDSIPKNESFVRVIASENQPQSGCWVRINGNYVWKDPCPY